jgi:hypothetical protein
MNPAGAPREKVPALPESSTGRRISESTRSDQQSAPIDLFLVLWVVLFQAFPINSHLGNM